MKTAVIIGPAYPLRGGLATFNHRFAEELNNSDLHTIIYTFKLQYPSFLFPGTSQLDFEQNYNDLEIRPRINSLDPFNWRKVAGEIVALNPDIVICRYWLPLLAPCLGSILKLVKKKCNAKIIGLVDNLIPHEHRPGDKVLTTYFMSSIDYFVVLSEKVRQDIASFKVNKPIIKLPHPVYDSYGESVSKEESRDRLGLEHQSTYLLFFGFVRPYKGLDLLLKALADPVLTDSSVNLIIAGEFYEKIDRYKQLIESLKIGQRIRLCPGYVPNQEVKYYFSACDLVALPYRSATQSGIAPIAFNFGKPVLTTNVGGLPETVREGINGFVSDPRPESIAQGVKRFLDSHQRNLFSKNILSSNHLYSWSAFTRVFLSQLDGSSYSLSVTAVSPQIAALEKELPL
ncbi:MAG: glycosyltransferase [Saprospiraceae bacterium]|nr:glycosyltransferase [Saprospiraceae bacterium]